MTLTGDVSAQLITMKEKIITKKTLKNLLFISYCLFHISNISAEQGFLSELSKEKIIPLFYLILECDEIYALGEYEENSDYTNPTGDAPSDIGFREITDGIISEIEWNSDVIEYGTLQMTAYLDENVSQKASELGRQQNPSLAGDPNKVLMSYR